MVYLDIIFILNVPRSCRIMSELKFVKVMMVERAMNKAW